ncbi:hypothetical protein FB451DRAFT_1175610 [Mycena latifolia]|nr:hypothetical protein FB451DRAFT_1175610 [Mycena latifolia]
MDLVLDLLYVASLGLLGMRLAHDAEVVFETHLASRGLPAWSVVTNNAMPSQLAISWFCAVAGPLAYLSAPPSSICPFFKQYGELSAGLGLETKAKDSTAIHCATIVIRVIMTVGTTWK